MISLVQLVEALRKLQLQIDEIDQHFFHQLIRLIIKFDESLRPFLEKSKQIINGVYEPSTEEFDYPLTYVEMPERKVNLANITESGEITGFWLITLSNLPTLWSMIQSYDVEALSCLTDIRTVTNLEKNISMTIYFFFSENEFFTNNVLSKQYKISFVTDEKYKTKKYATELIDTIGCEINWKTNDLTLAEECKIVKKRPSFFNFFYPPKLTNDSDCKPNLKIWHYLQIDYKLGLEFKKIIPKAVQYYLGEAVLRNEFSLNASLLMQWSKYYISTPEEEEMHKKELLYKEIAFSEAKEKITEEKGETIKHIAAKKVKIQRKEVKKPVKNKLTLCQTDGEEDELTKHGDLFEAKITERVSASTVESKNVAAGTKQNGNFKLEERNKVIKYNVEMKKTPNLVTQTAVSNNRKKCVRTTSSSRNNVTENSNTKKTSNNKGNLKI